MLIKLCILLTILMAESESEETSPIPNLIFTHPHKMAVKFYEDAATVQALRAIQKRRKSSGIDQYLNLYQQGRRELDLRNKTEAERLDQIMERLAGNPIHCFNLVWRTVHILPAIMQDLKELQDIEHKKTIEILAKAVEAFSEEDMKGVTHALIRIQFAYRIDPVHIAGGLILKNQTQGRLTVDQMMAIAQLCVDTAGDFRVGVNRLTAVGVEWAEAALVLCDRREGSKERRRIEKFLNTAAKIHNRGWNPPSWSRGILPNEEFFHAPLERERNGRRLRSEEAEFMHNLWTQEQTKAFMWYNVIDTYQLCRGIERGKQLIQLPCYLDTRKNPYFVIRPLKVEILHQDPEVLMLHDVILESEIEFLQHRSLNDLQVSTVLVEEENRSIRKVNSDRSQSSHILFDHFDPLLYKLSKRTSLITGLEVHSPKLETEEDRRLVQAEAWQIGSYSPGGHYLPHMDAFKGLDQLSVTPSGLWVGNRIATFMLYLSEVAGGGTVFTNLGIRANPTKGAALFWYNLHSNGTKDMRSMHSACPTALGIKWVSNKWIREGAQIWKRPCKLNSET